MRARPVGGLDEDLVVAGDEQRRIDAQKLRPVPGDVALFALGADGADELAVDAEPAAFGRGAP